MVVPSGEPVGLEDAADEFGGKGGGEATAHGKGYAGGKLAGNNYSGLSDFCQPDDVGLGLLDFVDDVLVLVAAAIPERENMPLLGRQAGRIVSRDLEERTSGPCRIPVLHELNPAAWQRQMPSMAINWVRDQRYLVGEPAFVVSIGRVPFRAPEATPDHVWCQR
jgi:hypothetical protein